MFENLKKKLKNVIFGISKKIEEPEPVAEEEHAEAVEQEIVEDAQAEASAVEIIKEAELAEAVKPVEDEVHETDVEQVIEETLSEKIPEEEVKLEEETEEIEELEKALVEDEQAEELIKEAKESEKTWEEKKLEKETGNVIEKVLAEELAKAEIKKTKEAEPVSAPEHAPEIDLTEAEEKIIIEAEKEAEEDFKARAKKIEKKEGLFSRIFKKKKGEGEVAVPKTKEKPKATLYERLLKKKISESDLDSVLWDLELALLENDVAKEVTEKINADIKEKLAGSETSRKSVQTIITDALKESIEGILRKEQLDVVKRAKEKKPKPLVILFFGFNGTGKTLTIGKFAKLLKDAGISSVMAAGDTFRAAAIEQLEIHAKNVGVPIIKQKRGSDSAAVIYDAISHAKSKGIDVVLADTAGRSDTNINLMDELKKVVRVNKPDLKIFVGDSLTGNDAADQAKVFHNAVGVDGTVLTKVDCDAKGGACLSVSYVTNAPIIYLGTGQGYDDMVPFRPEWFVNKVF